jgi:aminopeptidase N
MHTSGLLMHIIFMGDVLFKKALQEFMKRWKGKHPTPYDFFFTFEDAANDDYTWFWQPWFFNSGYPDLAIDTVTAKDGILKIQISKEGVLPIPVALTVTFKDGSLKRSYRSAAVWKSADEDDIWIEMETDKKPAVIELGNQYIPDADTTNNLWQSK